MAVNFSRQVYAPTFDVFARQATFTPVASQPGRSAYSGRGIYSTQPIDVLAEDSGVFSDQKTILDILGEEFDTPPRQGDIVFIGESDDIPAIGSFEIIEVFSNGGEITLELRKLVEAKP